MAKKFDNDDGVWRTIGGRRVFIRNGQDLASAMKESGKFKPKYDKKMFANDENYMKESEEKEEDRRIQKAIEDKETNEKISNTNKELKKEGKKEFDNRNKNKENYIKEFNEKYNNKEFYNKETNEVVNAETLANDYIQYGGSETFGEYSARRTKGLNQYKGEEKASKDIEKDSKKSAFELDKELREKESAYLDDYKGGNEKKANEIKKLHNELKNKAKEAGYDTAKTNWRDDLKEKTTNETMNDAIREKASSKYKSTKHEGFGDYNNDYIPVYNNEIDYTGDFSRANLSKLSDKELTTALNKQSELYKQALNEKLGDQRTRNGRMDKIFNTAKQQQYEKGTTALVKELENRGLDRYNIYNKSNGMLMVSSPTKEIAERQLKEMYDTDKSLQKTYGWKELPQYEMKKEKGGENVINNKLQRAGYKKYLKQHPNSKMTFEEYKNK